MTNQQHKNWLLNIYSLTEIFGPVQFTKQRSRPSDSIDGEL